LKIVLPKPALASKTYVAAGYAKYLSLSVAVLSAVSGATFLGAPLLDRFMDQEAARQIQAVSALATTVFGVLASASASSAQTGRLNAEGLVYTPDGKQGLNHREASPVLIPERAVDQDLLGLVAELSASKG
jgi:hypothetical protein